MRMVKFLHFQVVESVGTAIPALINSVASRGSAPATSGQNANNPQTANNQTRAASEDVITMYVRLLGSIHICNFLNYCMNLNYCVNDFLCSHLLCVVLQFPYYLNRNSIKNCTKMGTQPILEL